MTADLAAHIAAVEDESVTWGVDDCSAWSAAWIERATGIKVPLPSWSSREEAHALIAKAGSLAKLWTVALSESRFWPRRGALQFGDVVVVDMGRHGQVGMIIAHGRIGVWRTETGCTYRTLRPRSIVNAWQIIE